ncbi:MAG: fibronectin type III domain-containing protein [Actinomycetota bacterium]|nr:fibronectin type III domain-containing protein [Actinomycetota bacterium]
MTDRRRLTGWAVATLLVVGSVIVLRQTADTPAPNEPAPVDVTPAPVSRYAGEDVVLPEPGGRPERPREVTVHPGKDRLRIAWAAQRDMTFEVRWTGGGSRLVTVPETEITELTEDREYRVEVRAVDSFGQRSESAEVTGRPSSDTPLWRDGLTGLFDDFRDDSSLRSDLPGSLWHLSGYRGCVDLRTREPGETGQPIDLGCGADEAVLRSRQPMSVATASTGDGSTARFAVVTDAAGPGGSLTLDLVPGPADRLGDTLPEGAIRAIVDDGGARLDFGAGHAPVADPPPVTYAPPRGAGALHLFELEITEYGVMLSQDGVVVAAAAVRPLWKQAWALIGMSGPPGRESRVHLAAAGFSGPNSQAQSVIEVPVSPATRQVLGFDDPAPSSGTPRQPLINAIAARMVVTMTVPAGVDTTAIRVQLGSELLPAPLAVPGGSTVTAIAELPPSLLGSDGPDSLSPFVVRAPGAGAIVVESYLEIAPGPVDAPRTITQSQIGRPPPTVDALPAAAVDIGDSAGTPLSTPTVSPEGRLIALVTLNGSGAQWDTGSVAGVQGFQLWLDGRIAAGVPTSTDGPSAGGRYSISLALNRLTPGVHVLELRVFGMDGSQASVLKNFTVA